MARLFVQYDCDHADILQVIDAKRAEAAVGTIRVQICEIDVLERYWDNVAADISARARQSQDILSEKCQLEREENVREALVLHVSRDSGI